MSQQQTHTRQQFNNKQPEQPASLQKPVFSVLHPQDPSLLTIKIALQQALADYAQAIERWPTIEQQQKDNAFPYGPNQEKPQLDTGIAQCYLSLKIAESLDVLANHFKGE